MQCSYRKAAQPRVKSGKQGLYRDMPPRKARSIEEPCCTADALYHTPPNRAIASAWHFNASAGATEMYSELPTPHSSHSVCIVFGIKATSGKEHTR